MTVKPDELAAGDMISITNVINSRESLGSYQFIELQRLLIIESGDTCLRTVIIYMRHCFGQPRLNGDYRKPGDKLTISKQQLKCKTWRLL